MKQISPKLKKLIEGNPVAFATVDRGNQPNVIGVAFVKVISPSSLLVTDNFMRQTAKNLQQNKNVCLAAWDKKWKGCKLVGLARYCNAGKWLNYVKAMPENKGLPAKGAILVTVHKVIELK